MEPQLYNAIIVLGIALLGGLGTLVTALVAWLARKLDTNTKLTEQAKDASNGRLSEIIKLLETERTISAGLRAELRAQSDQIAYYRAQHPDLSTEFTDRRKAA